VPEGGSWSPGGTWRSRSCPVPGPGAGATGYVAVLELARALVAGVGATRHVAAPELPCARRWEPRDTWACAPVLPFIFDLELVRGVPGLQSTDTFDKIYLMD
jgi:hypothetical protein